jgi:protein-S-isoprenylcysteine O-methyltransferase Ste14
MSRLLALLYGVLCYLAFLGSFLYAIWFVWTLDRPQPAAPLAQAFLINTGLLALFAVQHSVMARLGFKRLWTRIVPLPVERSTYVLAASAALFLLVYLWQPIPEPVLWNLGASWAQTLLHVLFWAGWLVVLITTYLIDHFDLFGLKQVWRYFNGKTYAPPTFKVPSLYRFVRHPLYLGFLIAFWSTPRMTLGHLYFAFMTTAYILLAIQFEERDLVQHFGETYQQYRSGVSMLVPWPSKRE